MTNHFTYPSHNKPLYQCNLWKNQQSLAAIRNHCNHATNTNHFTQATHDKLFYILLSIRQLISPIPHMKKTLYPCPHDKLLQLCHHERPFLPYNHFTNSTMANYFDHATHNQPFHIFHPWKPWVLFHQDKPFHPFYRRHITYQKLKRYFTHLMCLCRGETFPGLCFFGNGWDHVAIDSSVLRP